VHLGAQPIEGAASAIAWLRARGVRILFMTNHTSRTVIQIIDRLDGLGVRAEPDELITSSAATAAVLAERGYRGKRAIVIGRAGVREALAQAGIALEDDPRRDDADVVVVGWDDEFTYADLRRASRAVHAGATLIATNDDPSFPQVDGLWPGAGAILAAVETAAGRRAEVIGKPHRPMMDTAARRLRDLAHVAIVGDNPSTDLAGGARLGWTTILVLSGVTTRAQVAALRPRPDLVIDSLAALIGDGRFGWTTAATGTQSS
jgi:HAD superfamily hydrolase (TIGR01450 family)